MKKIIGYFIKYPVAVNVVVLSFVFFGIMGIMQMKSSFFPLVPSKIINIQLAYPGASPQEMEEGVVLKIEDNLRGLVGIDRVTSVSSENTARITVEILKGYDIDVILADVKNAVDRVPSFPAGMEPPVVSKRENLTDAIRFTLSGEGVNLKSLKETAYKVERELIAKDGITQVNLFGFPDEEIEVALRENDLRAYQLSFDDVAGAVSNSSILTTGGSIKTDKEEYLIRANTKAYYAKELGHMVVRANADGTIIRLRDIATIKDRWSENPDRLYYNGDAAIEIGVQTTNSEDLIKATDIVRAYVVEFNEANKNLALNVTNDASITIRQRTELLLENGLVGIALVLLFLSLFLKPRLAFWVAFGLPVAFLGMFIFAPQLGVTINVLSLFGMIIVIGILVDDGIVIAENIYHHSEQGKGPIQAAIDGTMEVIPPIVSAILTTVIAFATFFFLDGRVGEFFSQVSTVVILTLLVSLIEALVILPAHIAHSGAVSKGSQTFLLNRYADQAMVWMRDKFYLPVLAFFLKNRFMGLAIPITLFMLTIGGVNGKIIRTTFFPAITSDRVAITLKMPQGTNESITAELIDKIEEAAWEVNETYTAKQTGNEEVVLNTIKRIGPGTANASLTVNLLPGESRDFSATEIANAIEEKTGPLYGIEQIEYGSGTNFGGKPVSVSLGGNNIKDLKGAKEALKAALSENEKLKDISDNDPAGIKEVKIELKENAYLLGLTLNTVMRQVRSAFFGQQAQRFQRGRDEVRIWVRYERENRSSLKFLDEMQIITPSGGRVALSEVASYSIARGEIDINHLDGQREIKVEANLKDQKESAVDILAEVRNEIMPTILAKYPSVTPLYEGQNREAAKMAASAGVVFPVIVFLIYLVIAFTFRSYEQPLLLIIMVPFSLIGVGWGHWVHDFPVNVLSMLGIIALIGIMVNDGLVLIEKFNNYLREGLKFDEALFSAGKSRFRAIFLTSLTTIAGLAPLVFEKSRQAQFLIPMAISIAYGIAIATFLTLLLLPIFLSLVNHIKVYHKYLMTGIKPTREEVERAIIEQKSLEHE